jgi:hypothetical protein
MTAAAMRMTFRSILFPLLDSISHNVSVNRFTAAIVLFLGCSYSITACTGANTDKHRRLDLLKERCTHSDPSSCFELGKRNLEGTDTDRDIALARRFFTKACDKNFAKACHNLGLLWREGHGGPADERKATALFKKACAKNNGPSCAQFAAVALSENSEQDQSEARAALDKACSFGIWQACNAFAVMCASGRGGDVDEAGAVRGFFAACQSGMEKSCESLKSLSENPRESVRQSCEQGDARSCFFFGKLADEGIFGPRNREEARAVYTKACNAHLPWACNNLGQMWADGVGGAEDMEKAASYFDIACRTDGLKGCANLALLTEWNGDLGRARALRERACYNGEPTSCARLAWFRSWGWGGKKDAVAAKAALEKACALGDANSCRGSRKSDK